jgi:hypothetical protein
MSSGLKQFPMHPLLRELGITPEMIKRHVVSVDIRPGVPPYCALAASTQKLRAKRRKKGLNVVTGAPLRRRANGAVIIPPGMSKSKYYRRRAELEKLP